MSKDDKSEVIIWVDCEMTGLGVDDELIEISVVPTDMQLNLLDPATGIDIVIKPTEKGLKRLKKNDFVRKMHEKSGLLTELENGQSLKQAATKVLKYIKQYEKRPQKALLGGNSVHTDKRFIDKYMKKVSGHLHYRIIDVSTIKELVKAWYPEKFRVYEQKDSRHRAMDDILDSIAELKLYRESVFK